jgi:hypothetical protein
MQLQVDGVFGVAQRRRADLIGCTLLSKVKLEMYSEEQLGKR